MRILQILAGDVWGGAEALVLELATHLRRDFVDIEVLLFNDLELAERLRDNGVPVHILSETTQRSPKILAGAWRLVHDLRPDVVHSHDAKANVIGAISAALTRRTVSMRTVHGASEFELEGHQILKRAYRWLDVQTTRAHGATVAVSTVLGHQLSAAGVARVSTIANGVDVASVTPDGPSARLPGRPDAFRVGMACRLVPLKRVDVLLRAVAQIPKSLGVEVVIFGDGPEEDAIRSLAAELDVKDRVHLVGFTASIHEALRALNALVITSDHEGLPMVLLEAMAVGTPVIAHSVGGIPDALGGTGVLLETQDPQGLARQIILLAEDREKCADLAAAARERVVAHHSIEATAVRYIDLYHRVSPSTGSGPA